MRGKTESPPSSPLAFKAMLTKLLVFLCNISPPLRRVLWRWWYSKLARRIQAEQWTFMNYGYAPAATGEKSLPLAEADEPNRLCIQLYEHVTKPAVLAGADILEVGAGRGGGASYLARYRGPSRATGIDFSPEAVTFCIRRHQAVDNLRFKIGDAENLPFGNASFDAVVNVESSPCYGDEQRFFSEAHRVLRPGGWFLFADFRDPKDVVKLEAALQSQPWTQAQREDITDDVRRALELDDLRKRALIAELIPQRLRPIFGEFAGLARGKVFKAFRERSLIYLRFAFRKPPAS